LRGKCERKKKKKKRQCNIDGELISAELVYISAELEIHYEITLAEI